MGTADTMLLSWLITGSFEAGLQIGVADVTTKLVLYYLHERAWFRYGRLGREDSEEQALTNDN